MSLKVVDRQTFHSKKYSDYAVSLDRPDILKVQKNVLSLFETPARLLEIGCADGMLAEHFVDRGWNVSAIEISEESAKNALGKGLDLKIGNVEEGIPFDKDTFNLVIAMEVIEHIFDTDFFLKEAYRVLKSDGVLILTTPNLLSLANRLLVLFGRYPRYVEYNAGENSAGHIRCYTLAVLKNQLAANGFMVEKAQSPNFSAPMKVLPSFLKRVSMALGDLLPSLGSHIIITARRD